MNTFTNSSSYHINFTLVYIFSMISTLQWLYIHTFIFIKMSTELLGCFTVLPHIN
jgi:hypothetical protein